MSNLTRPSRGVPGSLNDPRSTGAPSGPRGASTRRSGPVAPLNDARSTGAAPKQR